MRIKAIPQDPRYVITDEGDIYFLPRGTAIKPFKNPDGYLQVKLGKTNTYSVHRLVAQSFVHNFNPKEFDQVNHIDGNKENPHYMNLEWTNNSGNQKHAFETGLNNPKRGEENVNAKLTEEIVHGLCSLFEQGHSVAEAAQMMGVYELRKGAVRRVKARDNWKHVSVNYKF